MSKFLRVDFKIQPWGCARVGGIDMIASLSVEKVDSLGRGRGIADVVAVSHVWGDAQCLLENVKGASHTIKISSRKKMERLLNIAKSRDWEYLWLDNICINQEDVDEKSREVMKMGSVYRDTRATLVLLDSTHLKALDSAMKILLRFPGEVELTLLDEAMRDHGGWERLLELCIELGDDKWYERLWTVQECALASTIYMAPFDKDIAYDVSGVKKCMSIFFKLNEFATNRIHNWDGERLPRLRIIHTFIRRWKFGAKMSMWKALVDTQYANCSVAKDRVYGILGLIPEVKITPAYAEVSTEELVVTMMKECVNNLKEMDLLHMHGPKLKEMGKCMVPAWECYQRHMTKLSASGNVIHFGNCSYDENEGLMVSNPCVFRAKIIAVIEPEQLSEVRAGWIQTNYRALQKKLHGDQMVELLRGILVASGSNEINQGGKESTAREILDKAREVLDKARELLEVWAYVASLPPETMMRVTHVLKERYGWDENQQNQAIRVWSESLYKNGRAHVLSITKVNNCPGLCCKRTYISAFQSSAAVEDDLRVEETLLVVYYGGYFHSGGHCEPSRLPLIVAKTTQEGVKFISTIVLDQLLLHKAIASRRDKIIIV